jgi:hypothetical protein
VWCQALNRSLKLRVDSLFQALHSVPVHKLASVLAVIPAGVIYRGDLVQVVTTLTSYFPDPDHWIAILQTVCGGVGGCLQTCMPP